MTEVECAACGRAWDDNWTGREELEAELSVEGPEMSESASMSVEENPLNVIEFRGGVTILFLIFIFERMVDRT